MRRNMITCAAACLLLVLACITQESSQSGQSSATDTSHLPDSEMSGTRIWLSDGGRVTTEIFSERIVEFEQIDSSMSYGVHVSTYDSLGHPAGWVIADSAIIREKTGKLDLFGHVILVNSRQARLKTEYLHWDSEIDRMETEEYVDIKRGDDWVTGWGLKADGNLNEFKIKKVKDVHGDIMNIGIFNQQ